MEMLPVRMEAGVPESWSPQQVLDQVRRIQEVMKVAMKVDEHFGVIPGTKKPSLLKPGAEKLCLTFRFAPEYEVLPSSRFDDAFIIYDIRCKLIHIPTGALVGTGLGSCNSREEKYRWRTSARKCPECQAETIIKGKDEFGGGWLCYKKKGGCGAKFEADDARITEQKEGRILNDNPWDQANTIEKMGCKRSLVAAVLNATAASDIFTQDLEDSPAAEAHEARPTPPVPAAGRQEASNAPSAPPPPTSPSQADDNPAIVTIENVTVKTGMTNGKEWTRYSIVTDAGVIYSTFDKALAERAKEVKGYEVALSWERSGKYLNCTGFEPVGELAALVVEPDNANLAQGWEPGMDA